MSGRKYAVIMFTDIVGYKNLLRSDPKKASDELYDNRRLHRRLIGKHHGKLIKEIEDGILASFDLNSDAIRCSVDIQRESRKINISLRIGIHEGRLIFEGMDVGGDDVAIATQLQEISNEGCITISGSVYNEVKDKKGFSAEYLGEKRLDNIEDPVKVYSVKCYKLGEKFLEDKSVRKEKKHAVPYLIILLLLIILIITFLWSWLALPTYRKEMKEMEENKQDTLTTYRISPIIQSPGSFDR
jgi:class 3 adenylate cyclase